MSLADVLSNLDTGDIVTHCFPPSHPPDIPVPVIWNSKNEVIPEVYDAIKRGVIFDVGHGRGSFSFDTAEKSINQGFLPSTISTDVHSYNLKYPVYDMTTTMSKFLKMGLSLKEVVKLSTISPASVLGLDTQIGTLKEGHIGDAAIITHESGIFDFWDSINIKRVGKEIIRPYKVVKGGKLIK